MIQKKNGTDAALLSAQQDYTMNFSDDDQNNDNGDKNRSHRTNKGENNPNSRGFVPLIILAVVFIGIVAAMLYFFVFRTQSSQVSYGNADLIYSVDTNGDGKIDVDENGYPDFSGYDRYNSDGSVKTKFSDIVVDGSEGKLAKLMINNPSGYALKVSVVYSNATNQVVYLTGTYQEHTDKGNVNYSFQANLDRTIYEKYVTPILTNDSYYVYGTTYSQEIETSTDWSWVWSLLLTVLTVGVGFLLISRMLRSSGGGGNPMNGFVNNIARKSNGSKVRFSDVAGCDEAKAELVEMVDYFHSTDKYTRLGAKLPHGVLLVGPPGTGKTLLAKAVAGEANVPFYSISGSDFVEMYVGVGASRVRSLFKTAKQNAPCLIFIDEIDAVGRQRGAGLGGGNDEREQTLNELLVEMDGFEDNNGIIVMAATNRDDVLDPALTRPGRFDRKITVDHPDKAGRAAILKVHSRNKKLAPDVSFENIASRTVGFSGADLANIMNDAAILAVRANRTAITTADIDEAIDRAISGPAKRSHLEEKERRQVAYHEAGHAVIGIFLPYSDKVQKITIIPRGRTGGHVLMTPEQDRFLMTKNQLLARITGYLGGRTSEEIFFGDVSTGASNDIEVATNIARGMVTEYGMSDLGPIQYEKPGGSVFLGRDYNSSSANYSAQVAFEIDSQIRQIIDTCHTQCRQLLEEHRDDVTLIAETLIANETITADQIDYLLKNRELPPVDEHKLDDNCLVKNPNNIILYPGYDWYYSSIDKILEGKPSRLVLVVATGSGVPVSDVAFKKACITGAADPTHIGMFFVDFAHSQSISTSVETFAQHLENYAGVPTLLIRTDDNSVRHLQARFDIPLPVAPAVKDEKPVEEKPAEEQPQVEEQPQAEEKPAEEQSQTDEAEQNSDSTPSSDDDPNKQ